MGNDQIHNFCNSCKDNNNLFERNLTEPPIENGREPSTPKAAKIGNFKEKNLPINNLIDKKVENLCVFVKINENGTIYEGYVDDKNKKSGEGKVYDEQTGKLIFSGTFVNDEKHGFGNILIKVLKIFLMVQHILVRTLGIKSKVRVVWKLVMKKNILVIF